ncbi:hypothetical protein VOLCADRAFT_108296 [Volvox carteri f. nagariensis]|uniref:Secreted protein n=1 Tax=Volvox carteri f. nagariensis TaxID=3068 RepID=D8UJB6_VOLCA|nr:uncharacterized protein VOLCADRAFT_108296 [Volvox carteri f. nagariensis]EFJ40208.1 hypothetical protein VOLCADRAFT_108296 [Volvox carteri f. nagariensis]|eukprot:XP_002958752.1 hypothetical protein VOLCADRAFT_108296 [Volvox carteri f. nagariensis]
MRGCLSVIPSNLVVALWPPLFLMSCSCDEFPRGHRQSLLRTAASASANQARYLPHSQELRCHWKAPFDQFRIRKARACSIANGLTTCSRSLRTEHRMPVPWFQYSPRKAGRHTQIGYPLSLVYLILPRDFMHKTAGHKRLLRTCLLPSFGPKRPPVRRCRPFAVQQSLDLVFTGPVRDGMPFAVLSSVTHYISLLPSKDNSYCPPVLRYW